MRWMTCLAVTAAALALASAAEAQTARYDGAWEGALQIGPRKLRLELHVKTTDGHTEALLDSLDQGTTIPSTAVKEENGELGILFLAAGAELKGKLSPDGKTLAATWNQGPSLPMTLTRKAAK